MLEWVLFCALKILGMVAILAVTLFFHTCYAVFILYPVIIGNIEENNDANFDTKEQITYYIFHNYQ